MLGVGVADDAAEHCGQVVLQYKLNIHELIIVGKANNSVGGEC